MEVPQEIHSEDENLQRRSLLSFPASLSSLFTLYLTLLLSSDNDFRYGSTPSSYRRHHLERSHSFLFSAFFEHRTRFFDSKRTSLSSTSCQSFTRPRRVVSTSSGIRGIDPSRSTTYLLLSARFRFSSSSLSAAKRTCQEIFKWILQEQLLNCTCKKRNYWSENELEG